MTFQLNHRARNRLVELAWVRKTSMSQILKQLIEQAWEAERIDTLKRRKRNRR